MKPWLILFLTIRFLELANLETIDLWEKEELTLGVVDRIEGEKTVILVEKRKQELIIDTEKMELLAREDDWYLLSLKEEEAVLLKALPTVTSEQREKSSELVEKLRNKK